MDLFNNINLKIKAIWKKFRSLSLIKKGLVILIIFGLLLVLYKITVGKTSQIPQVQTTQAQKNTLVISVTGSGSVTSANNASIDTNSTGIVTEVYVENGDFVSVGQNIASLTLDSSSQQKNAAAYASYLSALSSLNASKSKMNSLQSALFKANQAFVNGKGNTPNPDTSDPTYIEQNADWLQAEADYTNQSGVISAAQASVNNAALQLSLVSNVISAPISGIVENLKINPGTQIANSQSTSSTSTSSNSTNSISVGTIKITDASLQASVNLSEIDVTKAKVGQKATLTLDAFPDKTFTGKVTAIDTNGSVSSGVTTYPTTITFDTNPDNIYPNMAVSATIITDIKNNVILIPSSAVHSLNGSTYVIVLRNGKQEQTNITTGESNDTQTEITSGLNVGDTVVVSTISTQRSGNQTTSPFGGGGFGGGAVRINGGGGGNATFRRAD